MKAHFSDYLNELSDGLKELVSILNGHFEYVSVLSTDSKGLNVRISQRSRSVSNQTMTTERGTVVRVSRNGLYSEYALNTFDPANVKEEAEVILKALNEQFELLEATGSSVYTTGLPEDEPLELFVEKETEQLPEETDLKGLVENLIRISDEGMKKGEDMIDCMVTAQSTHISKMFLTKNRDLRQSYVYSESNIVAMTSRGEVSRMNYEGISGLCGPELFDQLEDHLDSCCAKAIELLDAEHIVPGEYEVICSPEVTGLIAHEAFGHGVEMDMFVKNRALGKEYVNKRVGSDLLTMHEGALCAEGVTSYAFDDEGTLAGDVTEIENGILRTGICDALSAIRLGVKPTGNGKRENFEHKVYTRMTNTIIDSGTDTYEDMLKSVKYGYLLEGMESGMEDPKHWGIQCIIQCGREIVDGKLTGKVVAPVVMTGYVPDLLKGISMVSGDREVFGNGGCGKGYKEWVKVTDGGPYLKTKARLG